MVDRSTTQAGAVVAGDGMVRDVRRLVEDYVHADVVTVLDPSSGVVAPAVRSGSSVSVLPAKSFDDYRLTPRFRHGRAVLLSVDSLIGHVNRFKDAGSVVFADNSREAPSITAVLDYSPAGGAPDTGGPLPRFGKHLSHYAFPLSDEWQAWKEGDAQVMSMADFAAFLENRIIDVLYIIPGEDELSEDVQRLVNTLGGDQIVATPNRLIELARGLQVNESAVVQEAVNLSSGEGIVRFQSEHTDQHGQPVKVPSLFLIGIPVFKNGPLYRIAARLRYRKQGGRLVFWYEMWRTDRTFDHAFDEAVERVRVETDLPVLIGKPEA